MQEAHQNLKYQLWDKLKVIFDKYKNQSSVIETSRVKQIIRDVLGQTTKQEIDYVINNMFRLDADGSGTVDFLEFGNFLFKKHCGQMSLQKMHKIGLISHGAERKITLDQFLQLVNSAYKFLKVKADKNLAQKIFKEADKDEDNLITYVQYFKFIQKYVCQTQAQFAQYEKSPEKVKQPEPVKQENQRQWNSRLRLYLWLNLRKLYDIFVSGRELKADDATLRELIRFLLGDISQNQITFILNGLFRLDRSKLEFVPFAIAFFLLVAELGLSRYQNNNSLTKKTLNADQFILLLGNTFKFLSIGKVRRNILLLIFGLIDKNKDGLISINEYLDWIKRFLCVQVNRGDYYYLKEDDDSIEGGDIFQVENVFIIDPLASRINSSLAQNLSFSNWDLSDLVRKRVLELLIPYDVNKDLKFHQSQIASALKGILKESDVQIDYVIRNVFRYDRDGDNNVTYEQLTDFFVQQHFGEMAIQRLHKLGKYSRGKERIMNEIQFGITLNNALSYIGLQVSAEQVSILFSQLDRKKSGWISYQLYFLFLKYYFGSLRGKIRPSTSFVLDSDSQWYNSLKNLSALDRFIRLLFDQLRKIFLKYDYNKNMLFQQNEIEAILSNFFGFNEQQVNYVILNFFNFQKRENKSLTFDELVKILLEIYFIDIVLKRRYKDVSNSEWKDRRISQKQFVDLVLTACSFLQRKPSVEDLIQIFKFLDTDKDGYISFAQYVDFIIKYLGLGLNHHISKGPQPGSNKPVSDRPSQISEQQWSLIELIWGQLKVYFDRYDAGSKGYITEEQLRKFVIQVLHETTQRQLDYIFWNFFRVDPNKDRKIQFEQFAPFILNHAGQIALQRFHRQQVLGKSTLSQTELFVVFSNAFSFLSTMPKSESSVKAIYERIGKGSNPSYSAYVGWVNKALAKKFRK